MSRSRSVATAILGLALVAVFSLVFSLLASRGLWPGLPPGALHDTDLWAGFAAGVAILALLLRRRAARRSTGE